MCKIVKRKDWGAKVCAMLPAETAQSETEKAVLFRLSSGWKFWAPLSCCELTEDGSSVKIRGGENMPVTLFVDKKAEGGGYERTKELQKTLKDLVEFLSKSDGCPF